jgi:hypothetical protein
MCFSWRNSKRYLGLQISGAAAHAFCLTEGKLNYLWAVGVITHIFIGVFISLLAKSALLLKIWPELEIYL